MRGPLRAIKAIFLPSLISLSLSGCFYPPAKALLPAEKREIELKLPYDLAWDATVQVVKNNNFNLQVQDPVHGILEVQAKGFTLKDADCGVVSTLGGTQTNVPEANASAVYNFYIKPTGNESSSVGIEATFDAPVQIPFHPLRDVECVSRGAQEARILDEIARQAEHTHRPTYKATSD